MKKPLCSLIGVAVVLAMSAQAADTKTVAVPSKAMGKDVKTVVITPSSYAKGDGRYPVIYCLHGFGGNETVWGTQSNLAPLADRYGVIFVSPDGARGSWWIDSPVNPKMKYETFVSKELVKYIDSTYRTKAARRHRAVIGESMGGHGALYNAIRNRKVFGAVTSIYGGVDLRPFPNNWDLPKVLGSIAEHPGNWKEHSVVTQAETLKNGELAMLSIIGSSDFFLSVNRNLNDLLNKKGVEHYYIEVRGSDNQHSSHTYQFRMWVALPVAMRFFDNYFKSGRASLH